MAAKNTTVAPEQLTRAEAMQIALNLQPQSKEQGKGAGFLTRFVGNRIANAGMGFAAIGAGFERAQANYAVAYELERLRQAERTSDLILELDAQRKRLGIQ